MYKWLILRQHKSYWSNVASLVLYIYLISSQSVKALDMYAMWWSDSYPRQFCLISTRKCRVCFDTQVYVYWKEKIILGRDSQQIPSDFPLTIFWRHIYLPYTKCDYPWTSVHVHSSATHDLQLTPGHTGIFKSCDVWEKAVNDLNYNLCEYWSL